MTNRRDLIDAERAVLELEDELAAAKEYPPDGPEYMALKLRLREARRVYRTLREGGDPGVARPSTVETSAEVH